MIDELRRPPASRDDAIAILARLSPYRRLEALRVAAEDALGIWRASLDGKPIVYFDSIVGLRHQVDDTLPARALADVDRMLAGLPPEFATSHDYQEPITAMQDDDLDFAPRVELAYYAIYNLHRIAIGEAKLDGDVAIVVRQISNATGVPPDDWVIEWWKRLWDAWATRPDPAYEPSPISEAVFSAIASGEIAAAIDLLGESEAAGLVRAILLDLGGRPDDALALSAHVLGVDLSDAVVAGWLRDHLNGLVPEAIAVSAGRERYAVICGGHLAVRDAPTGSVYTEHWHDRINRLVRFEAASDVLWYAGDRLDELGVCGSFWLRRDVLAGAPRSLVELGGRRGLAALGASCVVARHPERAIVHGSDRHAVLGDTAVVGASISDDGAVIATHDGVRVAIYRDRTRVADVGPAIPAVGAAPDGADEVVATHDEKDVISGHRPARELVGSAAPRRLAIAGGKLFVTWANGTASLHALA